MSNGAHKIPLMAARAREVAARLSASDRACLAKMGAHLSCIDEPGLVTSVWSPFGNAYRYVLTDLGQEVHRIVFAAPAKPTEDT